MREIERIRETCRALSSPDLQLVLKGQEIELRRATGPSIKLPLKVIRDRGPDAVKEITPDKFNLFIDAGARLTALLRERPLTVPAVATSSGLLRVSTDRVLVDIQRVIDLPRRPKSGGPKLQAKSELVAEALITISITDALPSVTELAELASGELHSSVSVSQTQKVLARLEKDGVLKADRTRGPKYTRYYDLQKDQLLRLWAREYMPGVSRSIDLYITARDPDSVLTRLKKAGLSGSWAVSGPSAAQMWRPVLAPGPQVEIWVDEIAWDNVITLASQVDSGVANLTVRRLAGAQEPLWFAHHVVRRGIPLVSKARAYVEASASKGPRVDELADALFEELA